MNNYIPNLHDQSTSLKTYRICQQLKKANGDVAVVIEHVGKRFGKKSSDRSTQPKAKDRKDLHILYTHENIEKEHEVYLACRQYNRGAFNCTYELYRYSLKLVLDYRGANSAMSNLENFCLHFFLASLYNRLPEIDLAPFAAENYAKAFTFAAELQELDSTAVSSTQSKHRAIRLSRLFGYYDLSVEDILVSKIYMDRRVYQDLSPNSLEDLADAEIRNISDLSSYGLNDLPQLFKSIGCTNFSKLVLKLNALDALSHNRFKILFVSEMADKTHEGNYNQRNTVRISVSEGRENIRCNLLHELTHKAMNQVFNNNCMPYFKNHVDARQAYRESMKLVLLNLINFSGFSGDLGINKLAFNELVQFCFAEELLVNGIKEKKDPHVLDLFEQLDIVFENGYSVSELDIEFITNALQYLVNVENDSAYVRCVQPLLDYIDKFVTPAMEKYIAEHPCMIQGRLKV